MRNGLIVLWMLLGSITSALAQVSVNIGLPSVNIGINLPVYPELVPVPGYPVYYAPGGNSNYFFYDGMYWVYQRDNWYASSWYNGPWGLVAPEAVPLFVLRVPVRYYRHAPTYFRGWNSDAPPRWGDHWGNAWAQNRRGWDNWNRGSVPVAAPLPLYQRQYSGNRYPRVEQQHVLQTQNYRYQPREAVVQQHYQAQRVQSAPASSAQGKQGATQEKTSAPQTQKAAADARGPATATAPAQQPGPAAQQQKQPPPQPQQGAVRREQQSTSSQGQDKAAQGKAPAQAPAPMQGQDKAAQGKAPAQAPARMQGQDKAAQGKAPAQAPAPRQGQDKAAQGKAPAPAPKPVQPKPVQPKPVQDKRDKGDKREEHK